MRRWHWRRRLAALTSDCSRDERSVCWSAVFRPQGRRRRRQLSPGQRGLADRQTQRTEQVEESLLESLHWMLSTSSLCRRTAAVRGAVRRACAESQCRRRCRLHRRLAASRRRVRLLASRDFGLRRLEHTRRQALRTYVYILASVTHVYQPRVLGTDSKIGLSVKVKGKVGRAPPERRRGAHLPFKAIEPVGG